VETTLKSYNKALNGNQTNSHLHITHRADSVERALSIIEESVNAPIALAA